jgi:hypothetical protein
MGTIHFLLQLDTIHLRNREYTYFFKKKKKKKQIKYIDYVIQISIHLACQSLS